MKNFGVLVLLFFLPFVFFAQSAKKVDSLEHLLINVTDDSTRVAIQKRLYSLFYDSLPDKAAAISKNIVKTSKAANYEIGTASGYCLLGHHFVTKSEYDSANYYLHKSLQIGLDINKPKVSLNALEWIINVHLKRQNRDSALYYVAKAITIAESSPGISKEKLARIKLNEARIYYNEGGYEKAVAKYIEADALLERGYDDLKAFVKSQIGLVYYQLYRNDKAKSYYMQAQEIYERESNRNGYYFVENKLGNLAMDEGDHEQAVIHYTAAYEHFKSVNGLSDLEAICGNLGYIYLSLGKFGISERYFKEAFSYAEETKNTVSLPYLYNGLGELYAGLNRYDEAVIQFQKALSISEQTKSSTYIKETYSFLTEVYQKAGDFEKAFNSQTALHEIQDSIRKKADLVKINEIETKYQTEKKEQEIKLLTSQAELEKQKAKNEKSLFIAGILILGLAVIGLYFLFRNKQRTNDKLRQLEAAKSRFFANISHEFRTPLTLISGPVAHQLSKEKLSSEDKTDLGLIQRNANRLLDLVDQLLDLSKIEAGRRKLKISKGNLELFLKHLVEPFSYQSVRKGLTFNSNIKPTEEAWFDKDLVEKIIGNLLSNALKYCDENGKIDFKAEIVKDKVCIHVTNDDRNLTERDLPKLFDRFHQNNSVNQGFGIGLSLVKELAHLSHGEVKADKPNAGTVRFSVTLPISKKAFAKDELAMENSLLESAKPNPIAKMISMPEEEEQINDETLPLLLIVDDNEEIRLFIKSLLKNDYRVLQAKNGKEGVEVAFETIPDLIVSDVMMPVEDGIYLGNRLKSDERTSHIPIVLLTAKSAEEDELAGLKTGADAYMTKPFKEEKLRVVIEKLIASRTAIQEKFSKQIFLKPNEIELTSLDAQLLQRIQVILDDLLTDPNFGVTMFSDQIGLSRMHLHRKLKALTGYSTTEFIRAQRLKLAAQLIKKKGVNISEIGYAVGFNQPAYFSTCFKEYFGCSPSEYTS
ncbi:tetratricopeptide repeat protein [Maribacter polysiphoniae]|uniref:tetratricopeptide repeat protein n=1 Tax=Maribacter polysiphoniae TaxID=429344 RepID=UPI002355C545|nr:tetratricopeptide repeat protein [Maribacter polysiphoniae]